MSEATTPCANCQRLEEQVTALQEQVCLLQSSVTALQEQLAAARKDSSTSSKPPSSDIVKPPKPEPPPGQDRRHRGGQPGHPKHERALFPPEQVQEFFDHRLDCCPDCGGQLRPTGFGPQVVQTVDLPEVIPLLIHEHRRHEGFCPHCRQVHAAALPLPVQRSGLVGPRLTVLVAYLKGVCHASFSTIRKFFRDVLRLSISRGQLAKVIAKVSEALDQPYQELLESLAEQDRLNVDETSHRNNRERLWTWCFRAELYTLFKIDPRRSADVLLEVLGAEFDGLLGCDYFSAYRRYLRLSDVRVQFCLAHLIRDVKYLSTLPDPATRAYGERLRQGLRDLFEAYHQHEPVYRRSFPFSLEAARARLLRTALVDVPASREAQNLAGRLRQYGDSYFRFITETGVEPTNNLAEQAIRFVVIDRKVTQGTRSEVGQRWSERIWTVIASCAQQGRSVFEWLQLAVAAFCNGEPAPTLLPE